MKKLLAYQTIYDSNYEFIILQIIHELRIVSAKQIIELLQLDLSISTNSIYRHLRHLVQKEQIDFISDDVDKKTKCYYITRNGHNTIGGFYTFPKVPQYNLNHHLEVTNYLIKSLKKLNNSDKLLVAISERRQTYEKKDMTKNSRGTSYHVADYILKFQSKDYESEWHFEIELTLKSRRRYMTSVFPKYINLLNKNKQSQLIYVSPSRLINTELGKFKNYFRLKKIQGEYENIDENIFDRLHIFSSEEFENELDKLIMKEGI